MSKWYNHKMEKKEEEPKRATLLGIATIWADNDDGVMSLYQECYDIWKNYGKDYTIVRSYCVKRELDKCMENGLVDDRKKIDDMLTASDRELSQLGMEIVYALRTERLNKEYDA